MSTGLEEGFNRVTFLEDDEEVENQQVQEDLRLYGSRPEPPEAIDVGETMLPASPPRKRSSAEFEAAVNRPYKARRLAQKDFCHEAVTAIDWNSGATPLDAWLNQSAVPSPAPQQLQLQQSRHKDLVAREIEEIKVFRNVHIADAPEPALRNVIPDVPDEIASLGLQAQIYYRNIVDRYPLLPMYLIRRLAVSNHRRAERLQRLRTLAYPNIQRREDANLLAGYEPWSGSEISDFIHHFTIQTTESKSNTYDESFKRHPLRQNPFNRGLRPENVITSTTQHENTLPAKEDTSTTQYENTLPAKEDMNFHLDSGTFHHGSDLNNFWTGSNQGHHSGSVHSRSSSMNSSLHGYPTFDPLEQDPVFTKGGQRSASADFGTTSPGLPPPPVNLNQCKPFDCDICGKLVWVVRRLEWQ